MGLTQKYIFTASMDVDPDKEALFNEVYETEHVPNLMKVPGVVSVTRLIREPAAMRIGGEQRPLAAQGEPRHSAIYEIESPDVLLSDAWAQAVEAGRWPTAVRPYTRNRRHVLQRIVSHTP